MRIRRQHVTANGGEGRVTDASILHVGAVLRQGNLQPLSGWMQVAYSARCVGEYGVFFSKSTLI